jgi:hypothetical protein
MTDFRDYDGWKTTPPPEREERMTWVICKNDHGRLTRDPDAPCPQCNAPWRIAVGVLPKKAVNDE